MSLICWIELESLDSNNFKIIAFCFEYRQFGGLEGIWALPTSQLLVFFTGLS